VQNALKKVAGQQVAGRKVAGRQVAGRKVAGQKVRRSGSESVSESVSAFFDSDTDTDTDYTDPIAGRDTRLRQPTYRLSARAIPSDREHADAG
jgi:hypothetical protein